MKDCVTFVVFLGPKSFIKSLRLIESLAIKILFIICTVSHMLCLRQTCSYLCVTVVFVITIKHVFTGDLHEPVRHNITATHLLR